MKKALNMTLVGVVFVFSMTDAAKAQEIHSGHISSDETWTLEGSPHIIQALTTVNNGATLTIEPGVEVRFNEEATNPSLIIGEGGAGASPGTLIARGTATEKITFTSNASIPQPGDWSHIFFWSSSSDDSVIEHAIIEYADEGIDLYSANPAVRSCIIRNTLNAGIYINNGSSPEISDCRFEDNENYGIESTLSSPVLDRNTFINNQSYPIYINSSGATEPVIRGTNTFSGNNPDQIRYGVGTITTDHTLRYTGIPYFLPALTTVNNGATLTIEPGVEVRFNQEATNPSLIIGEGGAGASTGTLIAQGTATEKITFTSNASIPQPGDWSHIFFWSSSSDDSVIEHAIIEYADVGIDLYSANPAVRSCIIRNNLDAGISLAGSSSPEISFCDLTKNLIGINSSISSGMPEINNNNIFGNSSYGVYHSSGATNLNAVNNWWGDRSGPNDPSDDSSSGGLYNPNGLGDNVSDHVDYSTWRSGMIDITGDFNILMIVPILSEAAKNQENQ